MKISVACSCGKTSTHPEFEAGQSRFCEECGAKFTVPVPELAPGDAMPCQHCNELIRRSALKCRHCKKAIKVEIVCPGCQRVGKVTPSKLTGTPSCSRCGAKIPFDDSPEGIARLQSERLARQAAAPTLITGKPTLAPPPAAAPGQVVRDWDAAKHALTMGLSASAERELQDVLAEGERVLYRTRCAADREHSQLAVSDRALYVFEVGRGPADSSLIGALTGKSAEPALVAGQRSLRVVPLRAIQGMEIRQPLRKAPGALEFSGSFGHCALRLEDGLGYCKAVLLTKAIRELQARG